MNLKQDPKEETRAGNIPRRLKIKERPELNVFPLNVLFSQVTTKEGKMLGASALYEPDLESFKVDGKECSMKYHNVYGDSSWLVIKYNLSEKSYFGEKVVNGKTFGCAGGKEWRMFFFHFTILGLDQGEACSLLGPIEISPDDAEAQCNLGTDYAEQGRYTEAVAALKQAIRIKPDLAEAHYNLGMTYEDLNRCQEAIDAYKEAIRIKPDMSVAYNNLGVVYDKLCRHQEALDAYKQAIRVKPDNVEACRNLGTSYGQLGRYPEAIDAYKQSICIEPDNAKAHYYLGMAYSLYGNKSSALEQHRILKDMDSNLATKLFNLIHK